MGQHADQEEYTTTSSSTTTSTMDSDQLMEEQLGGSCRAHNICLHPFIVTILCKFAFVLLLLGVNWPVLFVFLVIQSNFLLPELHRISMN